MRYFRFWFRSILGLLELFLNRRLPESDKHRGGVIEQRRMTAFRLFVRYSQMISWVYLREVAVSRVTSIS